MVQCESGRGSILVLRRGQNLGIDMFAYSNNALMGFDYKASSKRQRRFWKDQNVPEIPIEYLSVMPAGKYNTPQSKAKVGWAVSGAYRPNYILFTFETWDHPIFIDRVSIQHTAIKKESEWRSLGFKFRPIDNRDNCEDGRKWETLCAFIPIDELKDSISEVCYGWR